MSKQEFEAAFQEVLADETNCYSCLSENARVVARWMIENMIDLDSGVMCGEGEATIEGEEVRFTVDEYYDYFNS